mmetsp:Transcript_18685/g.44304  ORF Transcript_18685/g.44304 Transcript_18685/m.44304 type:complete len:383 (+) Transcript_18685:69-1217(+)|eukprot:CAMPEP_0181430382 /NCGR_PEP_ID=MMETSP1110-20121109/17693_1 /TAXON_ID=174948 /ORGANISM="Symbiodinium sp., Strain CCMP421" /LENGTH=382 /DNA_ID=CAMNT_0023553693 /DNA_START=219 /DNA_END=1367 /DNA_ORIENTATION=-
MSFLRRLHAILVAFHVHAIHDSDRAQRSDGQDELMRRDGPRVRRAALVEDFGDKDFDAHPDADALLEGGMQAVRNRLAHAEAIRDEGAFQAALKEGEAVGLDESELAAFKETFSQPQILADEFRAEALLAKEAAESPESETPDPNEDPAQALIEEDQQPYGSYGDYGSAYPTVQAAAQALPSSYSSVFAPAPGLDKVKVSATADTEKDKEIDTSKIDYVGCIIPQWADGDWICMEAADVPDTQIYDDAQHRTRKKLREGDICTVQCPDPRYWQKAEPASLVCKSGRWRDEVSRINVKKIECETSGRWFFFFSFIAFGVPLCCAGAGVSAFLKMRKKKAGAEEPQPKENEENEAAEAAEAEPAGAGAGAEPEGAQSAPSQPSQ